ncbi:MAG TPA: xanthine dehydrogenase family protein subunit M [Pyrinomonadaceae bacterium]|jgi:CO/xanthine dehydrogenase FAD-binding subunit|nr:xanthine dehydrogenase family protein subunit M [Pyrinomonadaceae bacterium]
MRAYLPAYEMVVPRSLEEALGLLGEGPGVWRPFAGGTDLMVLLEAGRLAQRKFFSVWHLGELRGIEVTDTHVTLGALVTYTDVQKDEVLRREFPSLCRAASETGGWAIQNRGTLGGNIANASPAADSPPALLAHGAELELVSADGSRTVDYADFHTGYKQTVMRPDELIARIRLPRPAPGAAHFYRKVGTRRAQAISKVCFAGLAETDGGGGVRDVRLAVGSVAPVVVRCRRTEEVLKGRSISPAVAAEARAALEAEISPIDDIRSTARYRARVAQNLLAEFLSTLTPATA